MAKVAKIIEKMKAAPNGIDFREAAKVLEAHGYKHLKPTAAAITTFVMTLETSSR